MADPQSKITATDAFPVMSTGSLLGNVAVFLGELIQRATRDIATGEPVPIERVRVPLPFSRAAGSDYLRIVQLWTGYRAAHPVTAPPRSCPACRKDDSQFAFVSYDRYTYHECQQCGTWFVPLQIDERVIDEFFAAVPEARRIADQMMVGRDEGTRDNDRARFSGYFRMLGQLTPAGASRLRYLDIGSGVGHSVELAAELGWDATGVESSVVAVTTARAKGRNVQQPGDPAAAGPYDVVSLFETLEHITDPDPVLADAIRQLAPGGVVMITVPNRGSFEMSILRGRCFHIFGGSENVGHINLFDVRGLDALLTRHGLSLMFTDGQFSSDLPQMFSSLTVTGPSALDWAGQDHIDLALPSAAYTVLNNLGPAFSSLERSLKRSPILIAIACRHADRALLAASIAALEQGRRQELLAGIDEGSLALATHESQFRTLLADAQNEIARRDVLLAETATEFQKEINLRDELLEAERAKLDRTIDARLRRVLRRVSRGFSSRR